MSADTNVATIKSVYDAFGRGDVRTILNALSDDVNWATEAASTAVPWYGVRSGKSEVSAFFEQFGSTMEVDDFTPLAFAANETDVMTVVRMKAHHRANGRTMDMQMHHWFAFRDGLIAHHRATEDTAQVELLFRA
ncbi:nuclear transport factor 2 family protein [Streptomyces sp. NPDC020917]|uniref:nuclear transport factor 2 family protein n=1 Tax=Streptomyces sp. NPDC020917 TaxID=3365102 RepID=UPI0037A712FB